MRKMSITSFFSLILSVLSVHAHADCHGPTPPSIFPDTSSATEQDILAAQQSVKQYLSQMESVLKCMSDQHKEQDRDMAIDQMQKVAAKFNTVLHAFRSRPTT